MWLWTTVCCIVADDTKWRRSCDRIWQGRSTTKNHIYWAHGCQDEPTYTAATSAACQRDPSAAVWDMRLRPKECASANSRNSISQHCLTAGQASWRMGTSPRTKTLLLAGPTLRRGWSGWHNRGSGNKYGSSRWQLTREGDGCAGVAGLNHTFGETIFPWRDKLSKQGLAFKPLPSTFIWWLLWMIQGPIPKSYKEKTKAAMELFVLCNQFWYLCTSCLTNGRKCNGEAATSAGYFAPTTSATTSSGSHLSHIQQILPMQLRLSPVNQLHIVFAAPTSASSSLAVWFELFIWSQVRKVCQQSGEKCDTMILSCYEYRFTCIDRAQQERRPYKRVLSWSSWHLEPDCHSAGNYPICFGFKHRNKTKNISAFDTLFMWLLFLGQLVSETNAMQIPQWPHKK